jgi:hypothetical protein
VKAKSRIEKAVHIEPALGYFIQLGLLVSYEQLESDCTPSSQLDNERKSIAGWLVCL